MAGFNTILGATVLTLLVTIAGCVLRIVYMLGGSLQRLEEHDRRIGVLEHWRERAEA